MQKQNSAFFSAQAKEHFHDWVSLYTISYGQHESS